jgi:antitoxin component of MazEF toxin-antitoxin module
MTPSYPAQIIDINDAKGVCIPEEYLQLLGTMNVVLEWKEEGILIKPIEKPELSKGWETLFAQADASHAENIDWDDMLKDEVEKE